MKEKIMQFLISGGVDRFSYAPQGVRTKLTLTFEEFECFIKIVGQWILFKLNRPNSFFLNEEFNEYLDFLYKYLSGSEEFPGSHYKGIFTIGNCGSGKTLMMYILRHVFPFQSDLEKKVNYSDDLEIVKYPVLIPAFIKCEKITEYESRYKYKIPKIFDDLGREPEVSEYGIKRFPIQEMISDCYENGLITFATSNFTIDQLPYPDHIQSRLKEMMNVFVLKTIDKRQKVNYDSKWIKEFRDIYESIKEKKISEHVR